jgi:DNA modification methylase
MVIRALSGDCRAILPTLPDESVHCVVTSPPYWGLRDYGAAGQLGMEASPEAYVAELVAVFRKVRRALRNDGTLWLVLGDSYASGEVGRVDGAGEGRSLGQTQKPRSERRIKQSTGLAQKNLVGIPWRVAFALQEDGWYLRQDIVWAKPNPMPESVTDRCTKAHEYLFLLTKSARYYYDAEAIAEPFADERMGNPGAYQRTSQAAKGSNRDRQDTGFLNNGAGWNENGAKSSRNKRSVWTVATEPYPDAHFATFPPALIEPCISAGCPAQCCAKCGAPWVRKVETIRARPKSELRGKYAEENASVRIGGGASSIGLSNWHDGRFDAQRRTLGFAASCSCSADAVPGTVLDPFAGAGTTGLVADRLQRNAVLVELNPAYGTMAENRIWSDAPLFYQAWAAP